MPLDYHLAQPLILVMPSFKGVTTPIHCGWKQVDEAPLPFWSDGRNPSLFIFETTLFFRSYFYGTCLKYLPPSLNYFSFIIVANFFKFFFYYYLFIFIICDICFIFHLFFSLLFRACYSMLPSSKLDHHLLNVFNFKTPTIFKASCSTSCNKYILTPSFFFFCFLFLISFFSFNMLIKGNFTPHFHQFHC